MPETTPSPAVTFHRYKANFNDKYEVRAMYPNDPRTPVPADGFFLGTLIWTHGEWHYKNDTHYYLHTAKALEQIASMMSQLDAPC